MAGSISIIGALLIFITTFYFIVSGKLNRTITSFAGAIAMVVFGTIFNFYSQKEALYAVDFNTIGLLLGMMIIVTILKTSGIFSYLAVRMAKISKGDPWRLMALMCLTTAFLSMLVDNVTTLILVGPITILVSDILGINPLPTLLGEVVLSNIGGVGTLVGDPPNMLIGSAAGFTFNDFIVNLFPKVLIVMVLAMFVLRFIFREELSKKPTNINAVMNLDEKSSIRDSGVLIKGLISLCLVFVLFLFQEKLGLYPCFIALMGAALSFLLVRPDPAKILRDVEWPVLLFFAGLFVLIGGIKATGALSWVAEKFVLLSEYNLVLSKLFLLWCAAILSGILGAVPFTIVMIPIVKAMVGFGVGTSSFWWILALGVGLGGNSTPVGTAAGVLGMTLSEKSRSPIDFKIWFKSGTIVMLVSLIFISLIITLI